MHLNENKSHVHVNCRTGQKRVKSFGVGEGHLYIYFITPDV